MCPCPLKATTAEGAAADAFNGAFTAGRRGPNVRPIRRYSKSEAAALAKQATALRQLALIPSQGRRRAGSSAVATEEGPGGAQMQGGSTGDAARPAAGLHRGALRQDGAGLPAGEPGVGTQSRGVALQSRTPQSSTEAMAKMQRIRLSTLSQAASQLAQVAGVAPASVKDAMPVAPRGSLELQGTAMRQWQHGDALRPASLLQSMYQACGLLADADSGPEECPSLQQSIGQQPSRPSSSEDTVSPHGSSSNGHLGVAPHGVAAASAGSRLTWGDILEVALAATGMPAATAGELAAVVAGLYLRSADLSSWEGWPALLALTAGAESELCGGAAARDPAVPASLLQNVMAELQGNARYVWGSLERVACACGSTARVPLCLAFKLSSFILLPFRIHCRFKPLHCTLGAEEQQVWTLQAELSCGSGIRTHWATAYEDELAQLQLYG
jgi:hypothetical protein